MVDLPQPRQPAHDPGADPAEAIRDADEVEFHPCPRCDVRPGSPCRSRSGAVAGTYHTGRFTKVPRLAKRLRVQTRGLSSNRTASHDKEPGGRLLS